mmetsp:Transcript_58351/g.128182  ORF Transcript_58351/g.128182 Transcript_58351/m.128182 type:complete len:280 (-) Transcript_58351:76-915(-)
MAIKTMFLSVVLVVLASFCAASDASAPQLRGAKSDEAGQEDKNTNSVINGNDDNNDKMSEQSDQSKGPTAKTTTIMMPVPMACTCSMEGKCSCTTTAPTSMSTSTSTGNGASSSSLLRLEERLRNRTEALTAFWQSLKNMNEEVSQNLHCDCVVGSATCACLSKEDSSSSSSSSSSASSSASASAPSVQEQFSQFWTNGSPGRYGYGSEPAYQPAAVQTTAALNSSGAAVASVAASASSQRVPSVPESLENTFWGGCGCSPVGCYCGHLGGVGGASAAR